MESPVAPSQIDQVLDRHGYCVMVGSNDMPVQHWHRGIELVLVLTGNVEVFSASWRGKLRSGEASMYRAHDLHGAGSGFTRSVLHFVPDLLPAGSVATLSRLLDNDMAFHLSLRPDSVSRMIWASQELLALSTRRGVLPSVQALMGVVLAEMEVALHNPWKPSDTDLLQDITDYMRANFASEETLDVLAQRFCISRGHLHYIFSNNLGCTPRQYWLELKLKEACRLLQGNDSIQNISATVGFLSTRGFEQAFQRTFKMTPSEYRIRTWSTT